MANKITFGEDKTVLYKEVSGNVFPKNTEIVVPEDYVVTIWQNGTIAECVVGPKTVKLCKKDIPDLKYGFFDTKIKCMIFYEKKKHEVYRQIYINKKYKYAGSDKMAFFNYSFVIEFIVKYGNSITLNGFTRKMGPQPNGVFIREKDMKDLIDMWVDQYFVKNYHKQFMNDVYIASEIRNRDAKEAEFLQGLELYVSNYFEKIIGYKGNCKVLGMHDRLTIL